ncbi:glycosyltransferase involved in cell wall biosynthesis [Streptosporangium becharense]|uniref:Glycosyltransferase involved in cell wall biosynthesis n=1 Tax=Streptosporangium becharense TaxID=1816182 RepID=A0A7W9IDX9_9ACTN|nr:glycosyltransferase [Streptosporangium becharense]MBB2910103.1 glycosyltransferase involved in cell wall biosynthesis [Streptosporangium becharense]MBB5818942.1 glycosyltransferase involved in cell wall biosynthesis [Streptosporangium becharense]
MVMSVSTPQLAPALPATRPRRVLIGTDTYPPDVNGAAYFTHRLACGLASRGNEVHVVCASDEGPARTEHVEGVTVHRMRSAPVLVHPTMRVSLPVRLDRLIEAIAPDVVHVQGHFVVGRAAVAASRRAGIPVVATNHFMPDNLFQFARVPGRLRDRAGALAWKDFNRVFSRADRVTTPTRIAAGLLSDKGFGPPVEAVSCGIDLARFRPGTGPRAWAREAAGLPDRDTILFVGRLDEEKRLGELIRALPYVLNDTDAQLALVGTGGQRGALERLAHRIGVGDRVVFLGFVPDEALPGVYAAADVFAMPGVAELQSIATLEAMASGLPVVAADAMALPHLVRPGENGHLFRPGDVPELARRLSGLLASPALRTTMGAASRRIALTHDHQASLARFEAIYREVAR